MRTVFYLFMVCVFFTQGILSQCPIGNNEPICKAVLAGFIFDLVYQNDTNPLNYEAHEYPNPFIDLQDNTNIDNKLKVLSYLSYGDGISVFHYANQHTYCFKKEASQTKLEVLIAVMEAWNIQPDYSGSAPYNDIDPNSYAFGYVNKAHDEGIISGGSNFNPDDIFTQGETVSLINEIVNSSYHPVTENLYSSNNYFEPGIYFPDNLTTSPSLSQGVLNHYSKGSFVIPDVKMNLNFSHFYSTTMVEMPQSFYPIKPLGRGWSHTYNSYITRESNVIGSDDLFFVTWPNGNVHIFNEDEGNDGEYISKTIFDEFDELGNGDIRITKKNQMRYYFEQLDNAIDVWYLIEIRDPNGNSIEIEYESAEADDYYRIDYVESPSGKKLEFSYRADTDLIDEVEDPIQRKIFFEYNGVGGVWVYRYPILATFEDAKNHLTTYQYDDSGQYNIHLLNRIDLPRGNHIEAEYDENGKLSEYQINNDDPIEINVDFNHTTQQEIVHVTTPVEGGAEFDETYSFNQNGLVKTYNSNTDNLTIDYPNSGLRVMLPDNTNLNGLEIDYDYDNNGNITKIDTENGDIIEEFDYDNNNNLVEHTGPNGNITDYIYDNDENLIQITDAEGGIINLQYDSFGQLIARTNQEGITVNYTYENDGVVSSMQAPEGISTNYSYDGVNRLLSKNENGLASHYTYDPNDNVVTFLNSGGFLTSYNYDENDNLTEIINANNVSTSFEYDNEDRVIEERFGNLVKEYEYGDEGYLEEYTKPSGQQINYEYDDDGRLEETGTVTDIDYNNRNLIESISNDYGDIEFRYDDLNRIEVITTVHGYDVEYDFEDSGHLEEIIYPTINGIELEARYGYDDKNRVFIVTVEKNVGTQNVNIAEYDYLADDRIEQIDFDNNTRTNYSYDAAGRLDYVEHFTIGATTSSYISNLSLNSRGNITFSSELFTPNTNVSITSENESYNYNQNNHITQVNSTDYEVNDDGNTVEIGNNSILQYDVDDRLISYTDIDSNFNYDYNPYGQRIMATKDGVVSKYIRDVLNDNILIEMDDNDNPLYYYIYHPSGTLLARMKPNGELFYYQADVRGSVVLINDENGDVTHKYRYNDFGTITAMEEASGEPNPFKYVGAYGVETDDTDLTYMRARYYKPNIGRFLSEDPIWSTNLYPYADNNPISRIDSKGTSSQSLNNNDLFDVSTTGVSGSFVIFGGFNAGINVNHINTGIHKSNCPIITGTFGAGVGANVGVSAKIGGYNFYGPEGIQKGDLNSSGEYNFNIDSGIPGPDIGLYYETDKTEGGGFLEGIFITAGIGTGGASFNKNTTRTFIDFNKINDYFGLNLCNHN